jgi:hypothetical protein
MLPGEFEFEWVVDLFGESLESISCKLPSRGYWFKLFHSNSLRINSESKRTCVKFSSMVLTQCFAGQVAKHFAFSQVQIPLQCHVFSCTLNPPKIDVRIVKFTSSLLLHIDKDLNGARCLHALNLASPRALLGTKGWCQHLEHFGLRRGWCAKQRGCRVGISLGWHGIELNLGEIWRR